MKNIIVLFVFLFVVGIAEAKHIHREVEYQRYYCAKIGGITEYQLDDRCRVDCLTRAHAIEFDFAPKWAESIGQSLYYAIKTNKKAGVVLILENGIQDDKFLKRLKTVADKLNIDVWTMTPEDLAQE